MYRYEPLGHVYSSGDAAMLQVWDRLTHRVAVSRLAFDHSPVRTDDSAFETKLATKDEVDRLEAEVTRLVAQKQAEARRLEAQKLNGPENASVEASK